MVKGEDALDLWTVPHIAAGATLGLVLPVRRVLAAVVAFEAVEALLRRNGGSEGGVFEHESWQNIVADVVVAVAAAAIVRGLRRGR